MKNELLVKIMDWKSKNIIGEKRNIYKINNSIKKDEFLLLIKMSLSIKALETNIIIEDSKLFQTLAQYDNTLNAQGDIDRFCDLCNKIESSFTEKFQEKLNLVIDNFDNLEEIEL